jgi:dienelactone hydrolase
MLGAMRQVALLLAFLLASGCATVRTPVFHAFKQPDGAGPFPAVVVLHTCGGVGPHIDVWMAVLAANGYASLAVDSFTPRGGGRCMAPGYFPATVDEMVDDATAALENLRARPGIDARRVAVLGFSYGGWAALRAGSPAHRQGEHRFAAIVAFYPVCTNNLERDVDTPTLILIGENDSDFLDQAANCNAQVHALQKTDRPVQIRMFPGLAHGFDMYDRKANREATVEMIQFLRREMP